MPDGKWSGHDVIEAVDMPRGIKLSALLFAGFVTLIAVSSCSKISPSREVSGQVFVVTRGGESIKLGLVEVRLYEASQAERAFTDWRQSVEGECEPKFNELERQARVILAEAERRENGTREQNFHEQLDAGLVRQTAVIYLSDIPGRRPALFNGAAALRNLPKEALARAKTDAEGKFSMAVPRFGSYVIVAAARREIGGETENYYWAVRLRKGEGQILLNNDNLVSTDNPDSVLHATNSGVEDCRKIIASIEGEFRSYANSDHALNVAPPRDEATPVLSPEFVTIKQPISLGADTVPAGTRLELVSKEESEVHVRYEGVVYGIPISATDLK